MKLATARFWNKAVLCCGLQPVSVALYAPKYPLKYELRLQCRLLAPTHRMLAMPEDVYQGEYIRLLEQRGGAAAIRKELEALDPVHAFVLLCYEDLRKEWCHRRMFAKWWETQIGEVVPELVEMDIPKLKRQKKMGAEIEDLF